MQIVGPELHREAECEAVLRTLPKWFGIEPALLMYARDSGQLPTFATVGESGLISAFITLRQHFPEAWEVHCMAVRAELRSGGLGSRLLAHAEDWLTAKGVRYLQVKTVAATSASAAYAQTREFYSRRGFAPLEVFPELWDPHNPALQCIKLLGGSSRSIERPVQKPLRAR
jgi:GNAT superfamily N-acetyltransferase